jgi:hypothetical protein
MIFKEEVIISFSRRTQHYSGLIHNRTLTFVSDDTHFRLVFFKNNPSVEWNLQYIFPALATFKMKKKNGRQSLKKCMSLEKELTYLSLFQFLIM